MKEQLVIPQIGESVTEAQIARWLVGNGDIVSKDQDIVEIDSDKTTLTLSAPAAGKIEILEQEETVLKIGHLIAEIDTSVSKDISEPETKSNKEPEQLNDEKAFDSSEKEVPQTAGKAVSSETPLIATPLAMKKMQVEGISPEDVYAHVLKYRIGVSDVEDFKQNQTSSSLSDSPAERTEHRKPMSPLRKKLAQRLVAVKNQTAMLTTFNEIDMSKLIDLRIRFKDDFQKKYGAKLGFMSFFVKACALALKKFPNVNAMIDKEEVVFFDYCDISIAVSTEKGLVVPVIRSSESLTIPQIEQVISDIAEKARKFKLLPTDLEGGTFTITNGGVFGSLLSTPIINPPQTAILGMHTIQERPVAVNGHVVVKPMMYVALSYDHRLIDGKESVGFLIEVKRLLENPIYLHIDGGDIYQDLLRL